MIDGENAVTRAGLDFGGLDDGDSEDFGVVIVRHADCFASSGHLVIGGLEIRNGERRRSYVTTDGIERGVHRCGFLHPHLGPRHRDLGQSPARMRCRLFALRRPIESELVRELPVHGNVIGRNGVPESDQEHPLYLQETAVLV